MRKRGKSNLFNCSSLLSDSYASTDEKGSTYSKDGSVNNGDDQATISNITVSNISGDITVGSSGDYPWTESTITQYSVNTYTS